MKFFRIYIVNYCAHERHLVLTIKRSGYAKPAIPMDIVTRISELSRSLQVENRRRDHRHAHTAHLNLKKESFSAIIPGRFNVDSTRL